MELRARTQTLELGETFAIARGERLEQDVVLVELEHDGVVGSGEAAPIDYWGETMDSALAFLVEEAPGLLGADPFALEAIGRRLGSRPGEQAAKAALDAALHDWVGKRLGLPVWRLLGLERGAPPTSYTIGIDSIEGTARRTRAARGFRALKVKVGGPEDLPRLEAVRAEADVPIRVDANEGWTLDAARELMPELVRLGVELIEQPFPAPDHESFRGLREVPGVPPLVVDEGLRELRDIPEIGSYADGVNVKLEKAGGSRNAIRMIHAARALGLRVMIGCMIGSELGIAPGAQISSLADHVDLDGHLLLASSPYRGLELSDGVVLPSSEPGLGVMAS